GVPPPRAVFTRPRLGLAVELGDVAGAVGHAGQVPGHLVDLYVGGLLGAVLLVRGLGHFDPFGFGHLLLAAGRDKAVAVRVAAEEGRSVVLDGLFERGCVGGLLLGVGAVV